MIALLIFATYFKFNIMNFIEELQWRGLLHNMIPNTDKFLAKEKVKGYIGFDPTGASLTVGNLVPIITLMRLQKAGHRPVALVGGATGMIGDPSGKSNERQLLDADALQYNVERIKQELGKFLDFDDKKEGAILVNNYDWFKEINVLDFLRNIGKHLTVNYMMAKDSVKSRLETGISFTEFSYQLIQGYDFVHLYKTLDCKLQLGGSDQWGNITAGTELIRRMLGGSAYAATFPLVTKADGTKFGKSEGGAVWLNPSMTSPYAFYQFWLNVSDEEALNYLKVYTFLNQQEIAAIVTEHAAAPHKRALQQCLAKEITTLVHSAQAYNTAVNASQILFGKGTKDSLLDLDESDFLSIFKGVPQCNVSRDSLHTGIDIINLTTEHGIFASKGEAKRAIKNNSISINKQKITSNEYLVSQQDLLNDRYILLQKGKKQYHLIIAE